MRKLETVTGTAAHLTTVAATTTTGLTAAFCRTTLPCRQRPAGAGPTWSAVAVLSKAAQVSVTQPALQFGLTRADLLAQWLQPVHAIHLGPVKQANLADQLARQPISVKFSQQG
jgi:hypothetical protein